MTDRQCRDCERMGREDPNDPAPGLCPECYEKRLERISVLFERACDKLVGPEGDVTPAIVWLAHALEHIGGETRRHAREHADQLAWRMVLESRQN